MASFGSINTALSAIRYSQVAMDVASENIANMNTAGYTRRQVDSASVAGGAAPTMWFRSTAVGEGVMVSGVSRITDELINHRVRREHAHQEQLGVQSESLARVELGLAEPGPDGLSGALGKFRTAWNNLVNAPTNAAARAGVLQAASAVVDSARTQARHVEGEAGDQRVRVLHDVAETNSLAADLARTNVAIVSGALNGSDVNALRDTRDQLATRLAELTGATTSIGADGAATVAIGSAVLVDAAQAGTVSIASGVTPAGGDDGAAITFAVTSPGGASAGVVAGGRLGGAAQLIDVRLDGYLADLGQVVQGIADTVNAQHAAGYDAAGAPGTAMFAYDPTDVLGTLAVGFTDPQRVAASSVPGGGADAANAEILAGLTSLGDDYQRLVTGFGAAVVETRRQVENQQVLTTQIDAARDQLGGVNLDEEMVDLTLMQRQYEAAARVMTVVDSMLDTLINRTGLLR